MDIIIYHGPVSSEKSYQLIEMHDFAVARGETPLVMKSGFDTRDGMYIKSRGTPEVLPAEKFSPDKHNPLVILDEAQWIPNLIGYIKDGLTNGIQRIYIGILRQDFRGVFYPNFVELVDFQIAQRSGTQFNMLWIGKTATCAHCADVAHFTNRIQVGDRPVEFNDYVDIPGHNYEPVCTKHHRFIGKSMPAEYAAQNRVVMEKMRNMKARMW